MRRLEEEAGEGCEEVGGGWMEEVGRGCEEVGGGRMRYSLSNYKDYLVIKGILRVVHIIIKYCYNLCCATVDVCV